MVSFANKLFNAFRKKDIIIFSVLNDSSEIKFGVYDKNINCIPLTATNINDFLMRLSNYLVMSRNLEFIRNFFPEFDSQKDIIQNSIIYDMKYNYNELKPKAAKEAIHMNLVPITKIVKVMSNNILIKNDNSVYLNIYKPSHIILKAQEVKDMTEINFFRINEFLKKFLDYDINELQYKYVINLLAWWLQNLGTKTPQVCLFLTGAQGSGKGIFTEKILFKILNPNDVTKINLKELMGFDGDIENKYLIFIDEITSSKTDVSFIRSKLKNVIANNRIKIEKKYKSAEIIDNYALYIMAKNDFNNSILEGTEDRRYAIIHTNQSLNDKWGNEAISNFVDKYLTTNAFEQDLINFTSYLLNLKVNEKLATSPFESEIREVLQDVVKDEDHYYSDIILALKEYIESAAILNLNIYPEIEEIENKLKFFTPNSHNYTTLEEKLTKMKSSIKCLYKDSAFYFKTPSIKRDLAERLGITKSRAQTILFEKGICKFENPVSPHISSVNKLNAVFYILNQRINPKLFEELQSYYKIKEAEIKSKG